MEISRNLRAENVVEQADDAVEDGGLDHVVPGDRQDVAHQHVLQVLGLAGGLAHGQDGAG